MKYISSYLIIFACLFVVQAQGQTFEYTENKGQWHQDVLFKGELSTGAFFLKKNGYRVLQHPPEELQAVKNALTGHGLENISPKAAAAIQASNINVGESGSGNEPVLTLRSHAYDVSFVNANAKVVFKQAKQLPGYFNYIIGNDPSKWTSNVHAFAEVWAEGMYPGIDVRYYSESGFLKYDLVLQPNARLQDVAIAYSGDVQLSLRSNGDLVVKTSIGEVVEKAPYSYQLINGQRKEISCRYVLNGNTVRIKANGYDPAQTLIIDPTLVFSSFTGSTSDNWGYTATYDAGGNLYAGGIVFGSGYPVTPGAFQTTYRGGNNATGEVRGFDIAIMKFNATGTARIYATFLGGTGNEQPHSLIVDNANNLVMAGRTTSTDYPTTTPRLGTGGKWDIVVTKLNAAGTGLVGSVMLGGQEDDGVNIKHKYTTPVSASSLQQNYGDDARSEVILDAAGNILVASCSRSGDFPITPGAIQTTLQGSQDALLLKFPPNLAGLLFSTYLGGNADDAAYVLAVSPAGNIYVGGGTTSANFPGNKTGTVGATFQGGLADGFIAEVTATGSSLVRSTFIGTGGLDQVYGIQFDRFGFVYCMGTSTGAFPVRNAAFSQTGGKQFIAKLNNDLSAWVYSTVFGTNVGTPNISPTAFLVDRCENVYVSGWGGPVINVTPGNNSFAASGTLGLTITPDAIQSQTDGRDFYFFVLEKDATRQLFGSYFGQQNAPGDNAGADHVDGGTSRFDAAGAIYQGICANCSPGQFPITPGVVGPTNPSGNCNQAVIKVNFDLSGIRSGVKSSIGSLDGDTSGCVPITVNFRDTVNLARSYEWDFGDGTQSITNTNNIAHTFNAVGSYRVRLISVDSTKCYPRDTSYVTIRIRDDIASVSAAATKLAPCESNTYRFDNLSVPFTGKPFRSNSFTWIFGDNSAPVVTGNGPVTHAFPGAGTYNVQLVLTDTNYCNAPDTFRLLLRVSPLVDARFDTPVSGCAPYAAVFSNNSLGGQQFLWQFGDGTTSTAANPVKNYTVPGIYVVKLIVVDSSTCNIIDSLQQTITVSGKPTADFSFTPLPAQENVITTFTNLSTVVPQYKWFFGDGDSLLTFRRDTTVRHQYNQTGTYNACLIAINEFGCPDTVCKPVPSIINPVIDVVSAFTPNGDGVNDRAVVFGYGVSKMMFRIYNRWGQLMYETTVPRSGWDGIFKGKPQPMDAYGYTLEAELVSGEKVKKSGSITLIR
ncbi:PKD domain-containing protein [Phnomibacter sp. MR]|uniref:DUF7948 domain-containing protein n=1 Tax=Phnomibacter sp. MR TaxID=3042318 RepID=UPI003A7FFDC5